MIIIKGVIYRSQMYRFVHKFENRKFITNYKCIISHIHSPNEDTIPKELNEFLGVAETQNFNNVLKDYRHGLYVYCIYIL